MTGAGTGAAAMCGVGPACIDNLSDARRIVDAKPALILNA
jgi:hypothetical protein